MDLEWPDLWTELCESDDDEPTEKSDSNRVACIFTLPYDIICEIFLALLDGEAPWRLRSHRAPLLLTRICTNWRRTVLATPALWARLEIRLHPPTKHRLLPDDFSQWITCVCPSPREIRFIGWATGREGEHMLAILRAHASSLKSFSLRVGTLDPRFLKDEVDLPVLEYLDLGRIRSVRSQPAGTGPHRLSAFQRLPALREASICSGPYALAMPYGQLEAITCEGLGLFPCLAVISHAPNLRQLDLLAIDSAGDPPTLPSNFPSTHENITHLTLSSSPSELLTLIPNLRFPALFSLSITAIDGYTPSISTFVTNSAASLHELEFRTRLGSIPSLTPESLRPLTHLTSLSLHGLTAPTTLALLHHFDLRLHPGPSFLPALYELCIKQPTMVLDDAVVLALRSRYEATPDMSLVFVWQHAPRPAPRYREEKIDWVGLKELFLDGMDLELIDAVFEPVVA
uniref:F-box domain-containing protein n=1 Tax=Mycena chlorophos TaxID=658473 RepID=A0ABQ0KWK8_MYCCL|nr:predicted protein [Mycena chlorophos]